MKIQGVVLKLLSSILLLYIFTHLFFTLCYFITHGVEIFCLLLFQNNKNALLYKNCCFNLQLQNYYKEKIVVTVITDTNYGWVKVKPVESLESYALSGPSNTCHVSEMF